MKISFITLLATFGFLINFLACGGSEYQQIVKKELGSGVRYDTMMFDMYFGQSSQEFFAKAWELNKTGIISHGDRNMNIKYTMKGVNGSDVSMLFYPVFDSELKIKKMDVEFSYAGWAPWNKHYQADKLVPVVKDSIELWYPGNPFLELDVDEETYWVKVDGNRRITMKSNKKQSVLVKIVDMLHEEN